MSPALAGGYFTTSATREALNNKLMNNFWASAEIKEKIHKYLTSENENITHQNLWNAAKAILKGEFIAIQTHLEKQENPQKT